MKIIDHNDLVGFSLKDQLENKNYGMLSDDHMTHLLKLCQKSGLSEVNGYQINTLHK